MILVYAHVNANKLILLRYGRKGKPFLVSLLPFNNSIGELLRYYPESEYETRLVRGYSLKQGEKYDRDYGFDQETLDTIHDFTLYAVIFNL